ncbi:putative 2'-5' RNA ligase [Kitasatospora setae KM-6054]|uniref:RNA 2',3'-cyclic phosphodiesterase n=1 Tax=Kitasatospora setae (strain ATCC 33774 / DSM 43861 / JCM 3304 / KCC A-0304 / NBRC 14216 / KM-6054) TaxID=452652 RepID=E4N756_KITSK|nr:putative 2'-5' RNA ligase [Kitasatospora setae KM-6054]
MPADALRVFVALAPPDEAKDELARALRPAYEAHPRLRWNRIEDWHVTLAFLGEVGAAAVPPLRAALAATAAGHPALRLGLRGGGHFDGRLLWSGVTGDLDGLHRLAAEVRALVRAQGLDHRDRPLHPHLTLARARRDDPEGVPAGAAVLAGFTGRPWWTPRLHLVGSNPVGDPAPRRYRDLVSWPLAVPPRSG